MSETVARSEERRGRFRRALARATLLELAVLALGVIAIVLFGLLARAVMHDEVMAFNRGALAAIHRSATPAFDRIAIAITWLGNVEAVILIALALGIALRRAGRRIDAWALAAVLIGGGVLSVTLKAVFQRPRPDVFEPLYHASGLSFPSGHSLISFCLFGFIAVWLVASNRRSALRWLGALVCLLLAAAVALSRLYIGVHWPSDIVAGMLVAVVWLTVCFIGRQIVRQRLGRREDLEPVA